MEQNIHKYEFYLNKLTLRI